MHDRLGTCRVYCVAPHLLMRDTQGPQCSDDSSTPKVYRYGTVGPLVTLRRGLQPRPAVAVEKPCRPGSSVLCVLRPYHDRPSVHELPGIIHT